MIFIKHLEDELVKDRLISFVRVGDDSNMSASQKRNRIRPDVSGSLLLEANERVEKEPGTDKIIINCVRVKRQELEYDEQVQVRVFYWAAFYGYNYFLRYLIEQKKWSPFIKSFRNRSIISGAIMGEQVETVRLLLGDYKYKDVSP